MEHSEPINLYPTSRVGKTLAIFVVAALVVTAMTALDAWDDFNDGFVKLCVMLVTS